MKRLSKLLALALWLGLVLAGCGGGDSGGSSTGATATGVFVDKPVQGIRYVFGNYSGLTGPGGTFTYRVGTIGTFRVGDIVLGQAPGASAVTLVDLVKTANPALTTAQAKQEATKIAQFLMTIDDDSDPWDMIVTPQVFNSYTGARFKATDLKVDNLETLCAEAKPHSALVSASAAFSQMSSATANLPVLKHAGEYVSARFGDDFVADAVVKADGTLEGIVANGEGEVLDLMGSVNAAGDVSIELYIHNTSTPVSGTTVTAHSNGAGTITGTAVDSTVVPNKTIPFTLVRVTTATNKYMGVYSGSYTGTSSGSWAFGIDTTGRLFGFAETDGTVVKLTGTVNMATGAISLGAVTGGGGFNGAIAADGTVSGTWTGGTSDSGTFTGSRLVLLFKF